MTQNSDSDIRSQELALKNGGLAYCFKFEDQEKSFWSFACASNCLKGRASLEVH